MIPPGKGGSSQILPLEVTKTNEIAKTQILVGQVIRRLKFLDLLQMKFQLTCLVILMAYCKYVQEFQICKAPFMGRNLDWNK